MKPLISIIIAAYNTSTYINRCLESIQVQTYSNIEVIIVDDGSSDGTSEICDSFARRDSRMTVIHKINEGQSVARNKALDQARGEYIAFIDSDDYVQPTFIEKLYNALILNNADISICNYKEVNECGTVISESCVIRDNILRRNELWQLSLGGTYMFSIALWNKLFRATIWEQLRFRPGYYAEDSFVFTEYSKDCEIFALVQEPLYNYTIRQNSLVHSYSIKQLDSVEAKLERVHYFIDIQELAFARITLHSTVEQLIIAYQKLDFNIEENKTRYYTLRKSYRALYSQCKIAANPLEIDLQCRLYNRSESVSSLYYSFRRLMADVISRLKSSFSA